MERRKNGTRIVSKRLRGLLLLGLCLLGVQLSFGQEESNRRGVWVELGIENGQTTRVGDFKGLSGGNSKGFVAYGTVGGHHFFGVKDLQLGLGLSYHGYASPRYLLFPGVHLEGKYKPIKSLRGLQLTTRFTLPLDDGFDNDIRFVAYDAKLSGALSVGWEFPRVLGSIGFYSALGVSVTAFRYRYPLGLLGRDAYDVVGSSQGCVFLRLGLLIN